MDFYGFGSFFIYFVIFVVISGFKVVKEYERGVKFTLGRYSCIMKPGLRIVIPLFQSWQRVDIRTRAIDVPDQEAITKDNVSLKVNAVLYFKVSDVKKSIIEVERFNFATSQIAQTTMRDVVGSASLDELLGNRDKISNKIREIVDKATDPWGIKVVSVELKDIELPEQLKRTIGKEAEAEREKRAVIIKAQGEVDASNNMAKAAKTLSSAQGALHLRTLQTLNDLSSDKSNTVVLGLPMELLRAIEREKNKK